MITANNENLPSTLWVTVIQIVKSSAVNNFFPQLASRAGKTEKLPAQIETYQPKSKYVSGTYG